MEQKNCGKNLKLDFRNRKVNVADIVKNALKYESIELVYLPFNDVKAILEACGSETKEFAWWAREEKDESDPAQFVIVKASKVIKILSLMPKLETFTLDLYEDSFKVEVDSANLSLNSPKLKTLHLSLKPQNLSAIYELFNQTSHQSSIIDHAVMLGSVDELEDQKFKESLRKFFEKQKSIKTFMTDNLEVLEFTKLLALDQFVFHSWCIKVHPNFSQLAEALRHQPKLKSFEFIGSDCEDFIDEVGKLSELEKIKFSLNDHQIIDCSKLKKLQNLKELSLSGNVSNFMQDFLDQSCSSLETLKLSGSHEIVGSGEVFENLPNLTQLRITFSQNLNTFAKFLPKLEQLTLNYKAIDFKFLDLDSGIVHQNLKRLEMNFTYWNFNDNIKEILEIFKIFPSLEELTIYGFNNELENISSSNLVDEKFFQRLSEIESLKSLILDGIDLKHFTNDFPQIAEGLKKLGNTIEHLKIKFMIEIEREASQNARPYKSLIEMLNEDFDVETFTSINHVLVKII